MDAVKSSYRVLVIDDNRSIHDDFRKIFLQDPQGENINQAREALFGEAHLPVGVERFELDCADQGETGLAMVQSALKEGRPYAVAFVDMRMPPGWDGL